MISVGKFDITEPWADALAGAPSIYAALRAPRRSVKVSDFGYPVAQENDAERAVRAALAIQRSLAEFLFLC